MEVYVQNNLTNEGKYIELPLRRKDLQNILRDEGLETEEGEYQTLFLRVWNLPPQPCVENLFLIALGYDVTEKCNLFCVETLSYVFYNDKIVVVHTTVTAYDTACEL